MMAASKKMLDQEPGEIELLLPFHAAGTLNWTMRPPMRSRMGPTIRK